MIIGIDVSPAYRKKKTGIEWYAWHLARGFAALHDSDVSFQFYTDCTSGEVIRDISPRVLSWPARYFWSETRLSYEMARHCPDVLFVPSRALPLIHPKKSVVTIHDVGFIPFPDERKRLSREYLLATSRYSATHASHIITVSEFTKKEIIRHFGIASEKITVTYLGFDKDRYRPGTKPVIRAENPYILCLGRRERRKNMVRLIAAYELLSDRMGRDIPDLIIVGPPGHHAREIDEARQGSRVASRILIKDWVGENEKLTLLKNAECLIHPSVYEGFGLPVIEAQACGIPVVSSNAASLPEIAGDGALYVDPFSIESIANGIEAALSHSTRNVLVRAGLANCERFSWARTVRDTLECLINV